MRMAQLHLMIKRALNGGVEAIDTGRDGSAVFSEDAWK